jgi:hypothetical protein
LVMSASPEEHVFDERRDGEDADGQQHNPEQPDDPPHGAHRPVAIMQCIMFASSSQAVAERAAAGVCSTARRGSPIPLIRP